jgi:hypothetical protein
MKLTKAKQFAALAILGAGCTVGANASPGTWTDYSNFTPDRLVSVFSPVTYTHDIRDGAGGFVVGTDSVDSYSLSLNLYDNNQKDFEIAILDQPGILGDRAFFDLSGTQYGDWSLQGVLMLEDTGRLTVTISSWFGDFFLGDSTLTVKGDKGSTRVPEPGTLALFGAALLGFGMRRRFRKA